MSSYQHPDLVALDEVEDLLEAYAEARLSPSRPLLARMRRTVLAEAAVAASAQSSNEPERARRRRAAFSLLFASMPRLRVPALGVASLTAAIMGMTMGAAVLAAPPGSPFYPTRVALEQAFLPSVADLDDRIASRERHLEERLAEAQAAGARGDIVALAAALAAYDAEVADTLAEIGEDAEQLAHVEAMLAKHVAVLTALESRVPEQASIDKALENSQKALVKVKEKAKSAKSAKPEGNRPTQEPGGGPPEDPGRP